MLRIVSAIIKKEAIQVLRDPMMLRIIILMPLIQLFVMGYAVNFEVKDIRLAVYDLERSADSRLLQSSFVGNGLFAVRRPEPGIMDIHRGFRENIHDAAVVIQNGFARDIAAGKAGRIGFVVDGANAFSASVAIGYASRVVYHFNRQRTGLDIPLSIREKRLYNPESKTVNFMVPGIAAVLLTMIAMMLTSMAIVRERERGTLEQLMVTPLPVSALIMGKVATFALVGFVELSLCLLIGFTWFRIPFVGSWGLLYFLSFIYLFTPLGIGMLISTLARTQQQAMFFAWFFSVFAMLTGGFFTPISNMPQVVQYLTLLNPLRYYLTIVRGISMKGATIGMLLPETLALAAFGTAMLTISYLKFSKRAD